MFQQLACATLLVAGLSFATTPAMAQTGNRFDFGSHPNASPHANNAGKWYGSITGGAIFPDDSESDALTDLGLSNDISFDTGYVINAAIGRYLDPFRLELELGYRSSDIDKAEIEGISVPSSFFRGDISALSLMVNGYLDIPVHRRADIYVGGGLGVAYVDANIRGSGTVGGVSFEFDDDQDTIFAWQVMAGVGFELTQDVTLTTGYRLWSGSDPDFDAGDFDMPLFHTVEIGLRFNF